MLGRTGQDAIDLLWPASRRVAVAVIAESRVPGVAIDECPLNAAVRIHHE
jgi:hypothetical protein